MSHMKLEVLNGMDKGVGTLKIQFEKIGFAVIWLKNPTSAEVMAAVEYLSSKEALMKFPESYKFFGVYTTCHGLYHSFLTKDECLPYSTVTNIAKSDNLTKMKLFLFIFDCCRSDSNVDTALFPDAVQDRTDPETNMGPNTMILYAQTGTQTTWGPRDGITYMAHELINLLNTDISLRSLPATIRKNLKMFNMPSRMIVPSHDTLSEDFVFIHERNKKCKFLEMYLT